MFNRRKLAQERLEVCLVHLLLAYQHWIFCGGLVTHLTGPEDSDFWLEKPEGVRQQWLTWMWPIKPVHNVGCAAPAALLYQNGTLDRLVPPSNAMRYQRAVSEPKTIFCYKRGHALGEYCQEIHLAWASRTRYIVLRGHALRYFPIHTYRGRMN